MAPTDVPSRLLPLAEEILDNAYARENLRDGAEKLRAAYERSRKRRVKPPRDRRLGLTLLLLTGLGAAVALAIDEDLRHSTLRSAKAIVAEVSGSEEPPAASDGSSS